MSEWGDWGNFVSSEFKPSLPTLPPHWQTPTEALTMRPITTTVLEIHWIQACPTVSTNRLRNMG